MASKISKECSAISRGLGERVAHVNRGFLALIVGFVCAMYVQAKFTLLLFAFMPFLIVMVILMSLSFKKSAMEQMKHYA